MGHPGFFLKTTDGGISWTSHSMSNHAKALVDVFFLSRDTGFVTGKSLANRGVILYTTDGGQTWTKKFESSATGQYVWKIQAVTTDFWVGSIQTFGEGKFTKSLDGGQTWIEKDAPIADMEGIGFATPQHGWVGSYGDGFYETFDSGENWEFKISEAITTGFIFLIQRWPMLPAILSTNSRTIPAVSLRPQAQLLKTMALKSAFLPTQQVPFWRFNLICRCVTT
jgi:photosystem II stability/assembly factor-like uncharacterized protein